MEKWKFTGDPQADIPRTILLRVESETLRRLAESSHTIGNRNMDPLADMKTAMARCKFVGAAAYSEAVAEQVSAWTETEEKKLVEDGSLGTTRSQARSCESGTRTFRGSQEVKLHEDEIVPYLKRAMAALKSGEECMSYHLDACPSPEEPGASYTRLLQKSEAIKSLQGLRDHFSEVIGPTMMELDSRKEAVDPSIVKTYQSYHETLTRVWGAIREESRKWYDAAKSQLEKDEQSGRLTPGSKAEAPQLSSSFATCATGEKCLHTPHKAWTVKPRL